MPTVRYRRALNSDVPSAAIMAATAGSLQRLPWDSAPLASQRACQVSPGHVCNHPSSADVPLRRTRILSGCWLPTARSYAIRVRSAAGSRVCGHTTTADGMPGAETE